MPSLEADETVFLQAVGKQTFKDPPRVLIIGAGSRGTAYAEAALSSTNSVIAAVCEPSDYKRGEFGRRFIWGSGKQATSDQSFSSWTDWKEGNWRKESKTAPSLLTKSCHDIDFLMWMLCSPGPNTENATPHLPSYITSTGSRKFFRRERKPKAAGSATNCLSCAHESECDYSAKKIYLERHLNNGNTDWPVKIVNPEIEDIYKTVGREAAEKQLLQNLAEDYNVDTPTSEVEQRPWFGRCVWESENDVCDDQMVTITWDDDPIAKDDDGLPLLHGRGAKTAQFHMIAFTEKQCERRGRIYGTKGEIEYDSTNIKVYNFSTGQTKTHNPHLAGGGHGGGDEGLARQFLMAVNAVDSGAMPASDAQRQYLGCDLDEAFRSHAMVFAAEDARTKRQVVDWKKWWTESVEYRLHER
ncbi:hypothetical protein ACET3X_000244 [Alternaria dauci]|uniref:Uncharacterized protein n=1 Tax=Alternaria dauci TaxID=48095 RepID=A0ABR3UUE8_9PLEO